MDFSLNWMMAHPGTSPLAHVPALWNETQRIMVKQSDERGWFLLTNLDRNDTVTARFKGSRETR
jgi:hypothetical protein